VYSKRADRSPLNWSERRELNPCGRPGSPIPNRFTHYALRRGFAGTFWAEGEVPEAGPRNRGTSQARTYVQGMV